MYIKVEHKLSSKHYIGLLHQQRLLHLCSNKICVYRIYYIIVIILILIRLRETTKQKIGRQSKKKKSK